MSHPANVRCEPVQSAPVTPSKLHVLLRRALRPVADLTARPGRGRRAATVVTGALLAAAATASLTAASPASATTISPSLSHTYYAGLLAPQGQSRNCFHFGNYAYEGPLAATGTAREYGVRVSTLSTDLEFRSGYGWVYCATVKNESTSITTGVDVIARTNLQQAQYVYSNPEGSIAAYSAQPYCFGPFATEPGPLVAQAFAQRVDVRLEITSTSLEHRLNYGWVYCVTVTNRSAYASDITVDQRYNPTHTNQFDYYAGYLAAGQSSTPWCSYFPTGATPVLAVATASEYGAALSSVVSHELTASSSTSTLTCVVVTNSSRIGTGVTLQTRAGL